MSRKSWSALVAVVLTAIAIVGYCRIFQPIWLPPSIPVVALGILAAAASAIVLAKEPIARRLMLVGYTVVFYTIMTTLTLWRF